ncbi:type II/IV secretion system ATPase subunit, partial [bacterium]|nr:type II/IV secretion system ATPase subunit [bacterium]
KKRVYRVVSKGKEFEKGLKKDSGRSTDELKNILSKSSGITKEIGNTLVKSNGITREIDDIFFDETNNVSKPEAPEIREETKNQKSDALGQFGQQLPPNIKEIVEFAVESRQKQPSVVHPILQGETSSSSASLGVGDEEPMDPVQSFVAFSAPDFVFDSQFGSSVEDEDIHVPQEFHLEGRNEVEAYALSDPFSYARICTDQETYEKYYVVMEPSLSDEERKQLDFIKSTLIKGLDINIEELEEKGARQYLKDRIIKISEDYLLNLSPGLMEKLFYYVERDALGFGKIDPLMKDPHIEDISCDGPGIPVFLYHRKHGSLKTSVMFETEEELSSFVIKLAQKCGKHVSIAEPMLDATMPEGSRVQLTLSTEVTTKGSTFTIRKFRADPLTPPDLVELNTMSPEMAAYMWMAVEYGASALFAGGTASGKTSTLNAMSLFIPPGAKIVSIEETRELNLPQPNWIPGLARSGFGEVIGNKLAGEIDMYDLMKAALRQRPEYIIVGEIRGKESYVLFQAMATGHTTYSTVHADSPQSLIHRLEGKPLDIPRIMMQSLDIVVIQSLVKVGGKRQRRCKLVIEIVGIDSKTKEILTNEVFRWIPERDEFDYSGKSYVLERVRGNTGISKAELDKEFQTRTEIIRWMKNKNIKSYKDVARLVSRYYEDPKSVIYEMKADTDVVQQIS